MKSLFASSTASPLLHLLVLQGSVLFIVIVVDHGRIQTHTLHHTSVVIAPTSYITVLIMELLDQLEEVIVDLCLIALRNRFLLLFVDVDLGPEYSLTIWLALATGCKLVQSALRDHGRYHGAISCLLLDRDDYLSVAFALELTGELRRQASRRLVVSWGMWRRVHIGAFFILLCLVLHLELSE